MKSAKPRARQNACPSWFAWATWILDPLDPTLPHPAEGRVEERGRDAPPPMGRAHADVGNLSALRLLEDRRRVIDPDDAQPHEIASRFGDPDLGFGVAVERAQEFAQLALGNDATAHPEEGVETGVVVRDQRPQRRDAVEIRGARGADPPLRRRILRSRFHSGSL